MLNTVLSASQVASYFALSGPMNRYYQHLCFAEQVIEPGSIAHSHTARTQGLRSQPWQWLLLTSVPHHLSSTSVKPTGPLSLSSCISHYNNSPQECWDWSKFSEWKRVEFLRQYPLSTLTIPRDAATHLQEPFPLSSGWILPSAFVQGSSPKSRPASFLLLVWESIRDMHLNMVDAQKC